MKTFEGRAIREVWDWRLSLAQPVLFNSGDTWLIKIIANDPGDPIWDEWPDVVLETGKNSERLVCEVVETDIPTCDANGKRNSLDCDAISRCYEIIYPLRDKYSLDCIDLRKPVVKLINESSAEIQAINFEISTALSFGDLFTVNDRDWETDK